jgi:capsular exopolysaccharide synthesis family protein
MNSRFELVRGNTAVAPTLDGNAFPTLRQVLPGEGQRVRQTDWQRVCAVLFKHWKAASMFVVGVVVLVTAATLAMKPVYEPEGRVQIDPPNSAVFSLDSATGNTSDSEYITTEAQKLQTDGLALATIRALHLDRNPEFAGKAAYQNPGAQSDSQTGAEDAALKTFASHITVRRDPSSRLVAVSFASHEARTSASVVNTLMTLFVERNFEARHEAIAESSKWLARELDDIRDKMQQSAAAVEQFQKANNIPDVDPSSNSYALEVGDLNKQLADAQADRIQLQAYLKSGSDLNSLPQVRNNPVIQTLTQKQAEASSDLAQSQVIYGANHPNVRKLQNQVDELGRAINAQREAIVAELRNSYRAATQREQLLSSKVNSTTQGLSTLSQYTALKREAQADRLLYDSLYAKVKEAAISAASKSSNIHVVNEARILDQPTRPHRLFNVLAGLLVGLIGGVALAFIREGMEDRIHTTDDMREWTGLSTIAVVPEIHTRHEKKTIAGGRPKLLLAGAVGSTQPDCFMLQRPNAPESEAVHALRTTLLMCQKKRPLNVILVTSPLPSEGKTTLANNLAIALAKTGKTCLVDADLRRPTIGANFHIPPGRGLEHYLQNVATLEQVSVQSPAVENLTIIPAMLPVENAVHLLTHQRMNQLISRLRELFEFVVIDTPPILPFADGRALSTIADGVVLVGRAGQTSRGAMMRSMELLAEVQSAPILTTVLNGAQNVSADYHYYNYRYN